MTRPFVGGLCVVLLAGLAAGCGSDSESNKPKAATGPTTATETERTDTVAVPTETAETTRTTQATHTGTSPEDRPGGAGDEEPARSQALLTGRGGRVRPAVVRVPAFIAIRVELRSGDGGTYALRFGHRTVRVGRTVRSVTADFSGLRPGKALTGEPVGGGNAVRVEATAEPGP